MATLLSTNSPRRWPRLATSREGTGKNIEYTKLQILTSLAIAAFEISWALAQTSVTFGASAAQIPVIEGTTSAAIRQAVSMLLRQIMSDLGDAMTKTMVHRIVKKAGVETAEARRTGAVHPEHPAGQWPPKGLRLEPGGHSSRQRTRRAARLRARSAMFGRRVLGDSWLKGAVVGYGAGMAKKVAGSLATGQPIDIVSVLGSASTAATGAIRGGQRRGARSHTSATADPDS